MVSIFNGGAIIEILGDINIRLNFQMATVSCYCASQNQMFEMYCVLNSLEFVSFALISNDLL
jgi:hypothetical protein